MLSGLDIALTPTQTKILTWIISILTLVVTGLIFYRAAGVQGWQHDVSWHTLNGLQTLRTHVISMTDTWTWKTPGHAWSDAEWLWDLSTAWIYLHFGWFAAFALFKEEFLFTVFMDGTKQFTASLGRYVVPKRVYVGRRPLWKTTQGITVFHNKIVGNGQHLLIGIGKTRF